MQMRMVNVLNVKKVMMLMMMDSVRRKLMIIVISMGMLIRMVMQWIRIVLLVRGFVEFA